MKLLYHIDENCRNLRDFVPILKEIHEDRGIKDVRILVTASEFFRDTGFRYEDRDIYLAGLKSDNRNNYFLQHYDLFKLRAPVAESSVYETAFIKQIDKFVKRSEDPYREYGPRKKIADDVGKHADHLLRKYAPQLLKDHSMFENGGSGRIKRRLYPPVADDPDDDRDPQRRIKHAIMLAAFMRSGEFGKVAKGLSKFYTQISNDVVDREIQDHISKSFISQGKDKTINFINVTNDVDHHNWVKGIIEDSNRTGQSFTMKGPVFKASCVALAQELRTEHEPARRGKCQRWAQRLEDMARKVKEDEREHKFSEYVHFIEKKQSKTGR